MARLCSERGRHKVIAVLGCAAVVTIVPARRADPLTGMNFVLVPASSFQMGSPETEKDREPQERLHRVTIERPFYLGVYEVTQAEWATVMGTNPSQFAGCARCPVERVSYYDVERFITRLNERSAWAGFRLPTEAEWEYACRAGGTAAYGNVATIDRSRANFNGTRTRPAGSYRPNAWGLFDMAGNVWEWTSDDYAPYPGVAAPETPAFTPDRKVIRGGSWLFGADSARCGLRYTHRPQDSGPSLGFRLAHGA
jgi:formylglycine-generating enzyme required for sulfatase activity